MRRSAKANIGRAIAAYVDGDCITPVRHELNTTWPGLVAATLGVRGNAGVWLDVGCGTGAGRSLMEEGGLSGYYVGVDLAPAAEWEQAKAADGDLQTRFLVCDVVEVDDAVGASVADGAVSISAFEHFPDDRAALAAVARVLKPGGALLMCVPGRWGRLVWGPRHGYHWYAPDDLERLAADTGMQLEFVRPVGGLASVILGAAWFLPAYVATKLVVALLALRHGGRRAEAHRRHPWTGDLLLRLQFAHCRGARGRRLHTRIVKAVSRLDRRARTPAPAWIAVLRAPGREGPHA